MTPQTTPNQTQSQQITSLMVKVDSITAAIDKLTVRFDAFNCNIADFRELYLVEHQKLSSEVSSHSKEIQSLGTRITDLQTRVDRDTKDLDTKLDSLTKDLLKLQLKIAPIVKLLIIVGGLLLSSVFLLLWDIFIGKLVVGF